MLNKPMDAWSVAFSSGVGIIAYLWLNGAFGWWVIFIIFVWAVVCGICSALSTPYTAPTVVKDEATRLAEQIIAEIEWEAGLIPMPDHLKPKLASTGSAGWPTTPGLAYDHIKSMERSVRESFGVPPNATLNEVKNACGEVLFTYYEDVPPKYEVHLEPLTAKAFGEYSDYINLPTEVGGHHIGYVGQRCSICEREENRFELAQA